MTDKPKVMLAEDFLPSLGCPTGPGTEDVTKWEIVHVAPLESEWYWHEALWEWRLTSCRWANKAIVARPVARRPEPKFKEGQEVRCHKGIGKIASSEWSCDTWYYTVRIGESYVCSRQDHLAPAPQKVSALDLQTATIAARDAEIERLRELLRQLEWSHDREYTSNQCPVCHGYKPKHNPGCELAAALAPQPDTRYGGWGACDKCREMVKNGTEHVCKGEFREAKP